MMVIVRNGGNIMKIFLSWSGDESKQLATIFKEWLPNVLQFVDPYMSAKDISLGERWNNSISGNLQESTFGLIFVTPSNINAPWINYEAGALSKTLDSKVVPILYNADVMILNEGPLKQFQSATNLEKESVLNLIKSINNSNLQLKLDENRLEKSFDMWWQTLNNSINEIVKDNATNNEKEPSQKEMLNVIFTKLIEQEKYLQKNNQNKVGIRRNEQYPAISSKVSDSLSRGIVALEMSKSQLNNGPYDSDLHDFIDETLNDLRESELYLLKRFVNSEERGIVKK